MPRKRLNLICKDCNKEFNERSKFNRHTGLNPRSGLPVCKVARQRVKKVLKTKADIDKKRSIEDFILSKGKRSEVIRLITNEWFNYLFNKFGTEKKYRAFKDMKNLYKEKLRRKNKNYYRWFKRGTKDTIDYAQNSFYYDFDLIPDGDDMIEPAKNPDYLGKGVMKRHLEGIVFDKLWLGFPKRYRDRCEKIIFKKNKLQPGKSLRDELKRVSRINSSGEHQFWSPHSDRVCGQCDYYLDTRPDWVLKFNTRHPKLYDALYEKNIHIWTDPVCSSCREKRKGDPEWDDPSLPTLYYGDEKKIKQYRKYLWKDEINITTI